MAYTTIDDPSAHFQVATYTGDGNDDRQVTNDGNSDLKPDLVWLKDRTQAQSHALFDSSRGATERIQSNNGNAESTEVATLKSFTTDGFTLGTSATINNGSNPDEYVAWQWKANGGTTSSNTDGNTTTTVQANTTAGFSIVLGSFTGSTKTYGHGLGVAPDVVFWKNRSNTNSWLWFTTVIDGTHDYGILNQGNAFSATSYDLPTSTVFYGNDDASTDFVAYCFKSIKGYSKFGTYKGRGLNDVSGGRVRGKYVHTGFKPAFVMTKRTSGSANWQMYHHKVPTYGNVIDLKLGANLDVAENGSDLGTTSQNNMDFYANGFRCTTGNTDTNSNGETYFYMAFAEHPFVTSTGIPTTAR